METKELQVVEGDRPLSTLDVRNQVNLIQESISERSQDAETRMFSTRLELRN
jgi:hypothetical protein